MNKFILALVCFLMASLAFARSGTGVANGGDPTFESLRETKIILQRTLRWLIDNPQDPSLCKYAFYDKELCFEWIMKAAPQILKITEGPEATAMVLRREPLYVPDILGKPMFVAARTTVGPTGPIEFHRDSIKIMPQNDLLFLMAHEFQHKVIFRGKYLKDDTSIQPGLSGRDLLDDVARVISGVAEENRWLERISHIQDSFDCKVTKNGLEFGTKVTSKRNYLGHRITDYKLSIGRTPLDPTLYVRENAKASLRLKFVVTDFNNCGVPLDVVWRNTNIEIIRTTELNEENFDEETLAQSTLPYNFMCPGQKNKFDITYKDVTFTCSYSGSTVLDN